MKYSSFLGEFRSTLVPYALASFVSLLLPPDLPADALLVSIAFSRI